MKEIISKEAAILSGKKRYFTGLPCLHGHVAERKTSNRECYQCSLERNREWFKNNPEKDKIKKRKHYEKHREKIIKKSCEYQKNNPHVPIATQARRRSRLKNSESNFTAKDVDRLIDLQNNKCAICSIRLTKKVKYEVDHIQPIARGGENNKENIQILCRECNRKKWAHDPIEFAQGNGKLL
jgi:5-methylcytosine-specific restriction endonuclease McrA